MKQFGSPSFPICDNIVNPAAVRHRSPFRYPGGKTWLVPTIRQWLSSLPPRNRQTFIEPFAGGAIVGLTVAFERLAEHVKLVEIDEQVAAVWETIINTDEGEWLAESILKFDFTAEKVNALLSPTNLSLRERALQTIIKNRVNRGGILAPGAGRLKHGENGRGISSRWYPQTLSKRILDIIAIRDRLSFVCEDGIAIIQKSEKCDDAVFFIDPPYTAAGKKAGRRLYTHSDLDHDMLFQVVARCKGNLLMTYNNDDEIENLAYRHGFETTNVAMKNTHHVKQVELLIGRDLDWITGT